MGLHAQPGRVVGLERGTVELSPYRPEWVDRYEAEVERLEAIADDRLFDFEHVGSTAVEGLVAKPIIDVLAVVPDLDDVAGLGAALEASGYERRPTDVHDRVFLARGPPTDRTHYLSLVERGSETYREQVAFRDYLRENPDVAAEYGALKRKLAAEYPDDRKSYTEAKSEFVERVLQRALRDE